MVKRVIQCVTVLVVATLPIACAAGGGSAGSLRWDVGDGTGLSVLNVTRDVLERYQYVIERQSETPFPTMQTHWYERVPFQDEREAGAEQVRTRFVMTSRERSQRLEGTSMYNVRLVAENQARMADGSDWQPLEVTPQFTDYATDIAERLRQDLSDGMRVF